MKKNKLVIESNEEKEIFNTLLKVEIDNTSYIIYTKQEHNDCGDVIAYAASYEYLNGVQTLNPVDNDMLELLDSILIQIQNKMNKNEDGEMNE